MPGLPAFLSSTLVTSVQMVKTGVEHDLQQSCSLTLPWKVEWLAGSDVDASECK